MKASELPEHKVALFLIHNEHKLYYQTAIEWIYEQDNRLEWESDTHRETAIATDSIWTLQWYPETSVGFFAIAAPTLEELLYFANKS